MKKTIILLLISFFVFGCKTKRVLKNQSKEVVKEQTILKTEIHKKDTQKETVNIEVKEDKKEETKDQKNDIQIIGKVDKDTPASYYNIVNGDTINSFQINGNADFTFKSSNSLQKSNVNKNTSTSTENEKDSEKSISNAVENVKNTIKEVQHKTVQVVKKDFTIGSYMVFLLWGLAIIAILVLVIWIRKSTWWTSIINKIK